MAGSYRLSSNIESIFNLYMEFRLMLETVSQWSSNKRNPDEVDPLPPLFRFGRSIFLIGSILHVTIVSADASVFVCVCILLTWLLCVIYLLFRFSHRQLRSVAGNTTRAEEKESQWMIRDRKIQHNIKRMMIMKCTVDKTIPISIIIASYMFQLDCCNENRAN